MTGIVARNYARALFDLAVEDSSLAAVERDMRAARNALWADREVRDFLGNRLVARAAKKRLLSAAFGDTLDPQVRTLLAMLVDRGRTRLLGEIEEELARLSRRARGVRRVRLTSAFPLEETQRARIAASLEARLGARVELEIEVRPSLIGGVTAESEGQEIEFSIEGQLKELAAALSTRERSTAGAEGIEGR